MVSSINRRSVKSRAQASQKRHKNRISDHIAFALIAYTLLMIFVVTPAINTKGMAIWPYFFLVAMVAAMVPFCRNIERRWKDDRDDVHDERTVARRFTIDRCTLWLVALGLPPLIALLFTLF